MDNTVIDNTEIVIRTPFRSDLVLVVSPDYPTPADVIRSHWDGYDNIRIEQQLLDSDSKLKTRVLLDMPMSAFADAINKVAYAYAYDIPDIAIHPDPSTVGVYKTKDMPKWVSDAIDSTLERLKAEETDIDSGC
jgi:hypothetical protein